MAKKVVNERYYPTEADVLQYKMLEKLLASSFSELKEFSKKKPDEILNSFKVRSLNRILTPIKEIMKNEPTASFLELLDEDAIPSYSDAVIIIAQFNAAMSQFKSMYYGKTNSFENPRWFTKENPGRHYSD